ncbi:MAG: thioredoxin [Alphaproteobacteria bacterium]|nr:thioredoxin [Alphaproteobacteria bacterium]
MDAIIGKPGKGPAPGAAVDAAIKDGSTATFMADVIDASAEAAIVVDFWAPWCGPCKQLGPALEKAVKDSKGAVRLVKINVDENPELAQQMRIQSIPAVYAFKDGRPVDGFVGALPDTQVKQFVQRLAALGGGGAASPIADALALAKEAHAAGDTARAVNIWTQVLQHEPENLEALVGLARAALAQKDAARATALIARVPADQANHADVAAVKTALELAEAGQKAAGEVGKLEARLAADPKDHQARLDLAVALFAAGDREKAIDQLFEIIKRDRAWNEEAARRQLLKFFEAIGLADPLTVAARRRLSTILFA